MTYYTMNGFGATPTTLAQDIVAKATADVDSYALPIGHIPLDLMAASDIEAKGMADIVWLMPVKPTIGQLVSLWKANKGIVDPVTLAKFSVGDPNVGEQLYNNLASIFGTNPGYTALYNNVIRIVTWASDISNAAARSEKSGDKLAATFYYYALALTLRTLNRLGLSAQVNPTAAITLADKTRQSLIDAKVAQATGVVKGLQLVGVSLKQQQELAAAKAAAAKAAADAAAQAQAAVAKAMAAADAKTKKLLADAEQRLRAAQQAAQSDVQAEKEKGSQTTLIVAAGVGVVAILAAVMLMRKKG